MYISNCEEKAVWEINGENRRAGGTGSDRDEAGGKDDLIEASI